MVLLRLPLSGDDVTLRQPVGADDVVVAEAPTLGLGFAADLLARLAPRSDGRAYDWHLAPLVDLDVALLVLRRLLHGDIIRTDARCRAEGCGAAVDIAFRISEYLAHHAPSSASDVLWDAQPGWFRFTDGGPRFRPPRVADIIDAATTPDPALALAARCVNPPTPDRSALARVAEALEVLAPNLYGELSGRCPECDAAVHVRFDPVTFVLREMRAQAVDVFDDVNALAGRYHWSEEQILQLPGSRRRRYVSQIRGSEA